MSWVFNSVYSNTQEIMKASVVDDLLTVDVHLMAERSNQGEQSWRQ